MTDSASIPELDVDPYAFDNLIDPYPMHERLRESGPVVTCEIHGPGPGAKVRETLNAVGYAATLMERGERFTDPQQAAYSTGAAPRIVARPR